jgi:hypothetical protein
MNKRKFSFPRSVLLFLVLLMATLGVNGIACAESKGRGNPDLPGANTESSKGNQLKSATNAGAALRKSQGLGRTTTHDDRLAAARRNAARKAAAAKAAGRLP